MTDRKIVALERSNRPESADKGAVHEPRDGLAAARAKLAEMAGAGAKVIRLDPIAKAKKDPNSLRLAVNAMCWDCCGAGADGIEHTKTTIRGCRVTRCPLHHKRPYQGDEPEAA